MSEQNDQRRSRGNNRRGRGGRGGRGRRGGRGGSRNRERVGDFKKPEEKAPEPVLKAVKICVECKETVQMQHYEIAVLELSKDGNSKVQMSCMLAVLLQSRVLQNSQVNEIESVISQDKVESGRLELLNCDVMKGHLSNPHLRPILEEIVSEKSSTDVRFLIDQAMQEPIFAEFARDAVGTMFPEEIEKQNEP
ncbi:unnamed protein product [Oikopleura dioica]|uniref:Zinc finger HIT domain-containing protein n=1 Tax=Oikopleura dioica TaxID=34765 RepID=E4WR08_OIKDI|nr:unnamed protein product [Oikopleura dioica]